MLRTAPLAGLAVLLATPLLLLGQITPPPTPGGGGVSSAICSATGGATNTLVCTASPLPSSLTAGTAVSLTVDANTTGATTLNIGVGGTKTLTGGNSLVLGVSYSVVYNGTTYVVQGVNGVSQYVATFTAQSGAFTITAATHGQGSKPSPQLCYDTTTTPPTAGLCPGLKVASNGDISYNFSTPFTGYEVILGAGYGSAGPTGPTGATGAAGASGSVIQLGKVVYGTTTSPTTFASGMTATLSAGSLAFTNIPQTYSMIEVLIVPLTTTGTSPTVGWQVNGDTTGPYFYNNGGGVVSGTSASIGTGATAQTNIRFYCIGYTLAGPKQCTSESSINAGTSTFWGPNWSGAGGAITSMTFLIPTLAWSTTSNSAATFTVNGYL